MNKTQILVSFKNDRQHREQAAKKFAMELLMPADVVRQEHARMVLPLAITLANTFQVPLDIMKERLDKLELSYID